MTRPVALVFGVLVIAALVRAPTPSSAATLPAGFRDEVVVSGLDSPTAVRFASDGRVFVAEKSGIVKVFQSLSDPTPTIFADLRTNVHNFWDRGLLGLALHPAFPRTPYVYVSYTHDATIGGNAPLWGTAGTDGDPCPSPLDDGCVVSGRVSRLQAEGDRMVGEEHVLIEDWCQQYPSHTVGALAFGPEGALYASGGEGASWTFADYGQKGSPPNPCGDAPAGRGGVQTPPTAEGGRLRSQDLRTPSDPAGLGGTIIRIDPITGAARSNNPLAGDPDANARRIVAYGLRNPFRFAFRPGSRNIYIGDVGNVDWEEINRIIDPADAHVENFGWPCYEGNGRQPAFDALDLNLCESLYGRAGAVRAPFYRYAHAAKVVAGETCPTGTSSLSGIAFAGAIGPYPDEYDGALFFADYSRSCIWAMLRGSGGLPTPARIRTLVAGASSPVDLQVGPSGELFYVDLQGGALHRIAYNGGNRPPDAVASAEPTNGAVPLTVSFDGGRSRDPEGGPLSYEWDLDGDGSFDDGFNALVTTTYENAGQYAARLRVTDEGGATDVSTPLIISAGNSAPTASIAAPDGTEKWSVGDVIAFSGSATDPEDGTLPSSAFSWSLILHHCPAGCHEHVVRSYAGTDSGSFVAPDHDYPSHLELRLTATDTGGLKSTDSVSLDPRTVELTFDSQPPGLRLAVGDSSGATPFARTVIVGSSNSISAISPQSLQNLSYTFSSWSDGGARAHTITAPAVPATLTATYVRSAVFALSNVRATDVTRTSAVIRWTTNQLSDSRVQYGRTTAYGTLKRNATMVTDHAMQISGLSPNTLYHYRAKSRNAAGVLKSSPDHTFRTVP